jgi:phospholipid/cholesterol/gamma-HCH transport system substrate-binding protein
MKKEISNKIKLGIFISIGMLLFIVGIYFIGQGQQLFRSTFRISGVFKDVAGLQPGNNVRLSGVNVGTVDNIRIVSDSSIQVDILIDERTRMYIKKDAIATIGTEGLMGNKAMIITPGTGGKKVIENDDTIQTAMPMNLDEIFLSLKSTIDNTSNITNDLAKITHTIQSGKGTIGRLLMDSSLSLNVDSTVFNLKKGSSEFKMLMVKANDLDDVLLSVRKTMDNVVTITGDVAAISGNVQAGKGVFGKLLMDTTAGNGTFGKLLMDSTAGKNFDSLFINLKEGSAGLKILLDKAKTSWLLWGVD